MLEARETSASVNKVLNRKINILSYMATALISICSHCLGHLRY